MTTTSAGTPAIETHELVRIFRDTRAVDGVSISIPAGEIYGFLGPNGAGKTTTVRMLCTLLRPTSGIARVAGFDVAERPTAVRMSIGVALQEASLDLGQTGRELLELQARLFSLPSAVARRRIAELVTLVDIGDALDRRVATYSGGMRRRLDLALALVHEPHILFLDEPTTGLDPVSRREVWNEVRRLNTERGITVFLTTQYLEEADALAHRVGIIADGRIVAEGTPDELKRKVGKDVIVLRVDGDPDLVHAAVISLPGIEHVDVAEHEVRMVVTDGPSAIPQVAARLALAEGITVREMTLRQPTLDDVFLEVAGREMAPTQGVAA
jgi:ABC-2 type transport system ATP-binding protein